MWISSIKIINFLPAIFGPNIRPDLLSIFSSNAVYTSIDFVLDEKLIFNFIKFSDGNEFK